MNLVNLTPHAIHICDETGTEIIRTIPSAGMARVSSTQNTLPSIDGIPMSETVFGEVTGLPEPEPGTTYIVSDFVLRAALAESEKAAQRQDWLVPVRDDLVRPDTGPTCVRKDGQIWAVRGLTR